MLTDINAPTENALESGDGMTSKSSPRDSNLPAILAVGVVGAMGLVTLGLAFAPRDAQAIPSFARQTGQPCATCHTAFPELTPFGRRFKLGGYTMGGGMPIAEAPPLAAMLLPTFTKTKVRQDTPPTDPNGYPFAHTNDNFVLQQASLFYGGQVYGDLGAFVQGTYDRSQQRTFLDNTDIRYTGTFKLGPKDMVLDVLWGLDVNNSPTVQDAWNTTPAWGSPYVGPNLAPAFTPPGTQIEGAFSGRTVGTGGYVFLNDMLYVEASAYHNLSKGQLNALGQACANNADDVANSAAWLAATAIPTVGYGPPAPSFGAPSPCTQASLSGAAPYWRVAFEPSWGEHSLMLGAFGWYPQELPGRIMGYGVDSFRDIGFDAQYQWISDEHAVTLKITRISEMQNLQATFAQGQAVNLASALGVANIYGVPLSLGGASSNPINYLTSFKASAGYVWNRTISGSVAYFDVHGTADGTLYGNAVLGLPGTSAVGLPDGRGLTFDTAYMPFSKGGPKEYPWANAKIGLSYTHYLKMFGGGSNFDGLGTYYNGSSWRSHSATDNNTLFLYTWIAF